jgi:helicase
LTSSTARGLVTRRGRIPFPAYLPVTTFGSKYPLDDLLRPYLPRLAPGIMVSRHYAQQMAPSDVPSIPLFVDSGGFASLFERATVGDEDGLGVIDLVTDDGVDRITPREVLDFQERIADVAFTLDFPIPPGMPVVEARRRQWLTIRNAAWALANRRRRDLPLYGCAQGWDVDSFAACAREYVWAGFDGIAIGGLVPRARDHGLLREVVAAVRVVVGDLPVHVFGLGQPTLVDLVLAAGADSVDSSAYVKLAADGRLWGGDGTISEPSPVERMHLALCNLAMAAGRTLPLSASRLRFSTPLLAGR